MKRKRLITLLMFFCILAGNAWGENKLYFEYNVVEFSNADNPGTDGSGNYLYQQHLLWLWNGETEPYDITENGKDGDFVITATTTEDLRITDYKEKIDDYNYVLNNTEVHFNGVQTSGNRGTITITATNPDFGGVTYQCSYQISYHMDNKKWSFYSKRLEIGRYKDDNPKSVFRDWCDKYPAKWVLENTGAVDPAYWYQDAINGDISLEATFGNPTTAVKLFSEAAGLIIDAPAGKFGMYNESDVEDYAEDRFIALKVGASVTIPASYFSDLAHPRIRIKMGRYGGPDADHPQINLTIINGKDALGNKITGEGTYQIGGSAWWGNKNDKHQRGEYHFIVDDNTKDFTINVHGGQFLKLYTIEVYNSETMITENSVLGSNYQLLTKKRNGITTPASGTYYLHYRGKGEHSHVVTNSTDNYAPTGTVYPQASDFTAYNGGIEHTYTAGTQYSTEVPFGTFEIRLDCYTINGLYCTDYAERSMSAGYFEKQTYPYTWDFTDVSTYAYSGGAMWNEGQYNDVIKYNKRYSWKIVEFDNDYTHYNTFRCGHQLGWDVSGHNIVYCGGSQLWCGKQILPEIAGLGFTPSNYSSSYNNSLQLLPYGDNQYKINGKDYHGILINQNKTSWWSYRITIPEVPDGGAVYARVHPLPFPADPNNPTENEAKYPIAGYTYGDYKKPVVKNNVVQDPGNVDVPIGSTSETKAITTNDGTGDIIYVIPGTSQSDGENENITLYFNGVIIEKIAVSTDKKTFNALGWTTESRNHDIDPSLTAEMNGRGIKTYAVTGVDYDKKKVTMTDISNAGLMHSASDGDNYACILRNTADEPLEVVNGGFYLFVPDMHDEQGSTTGDGYQLKDYVPSMKSSIMKAKVNYAVPTSMIDETTYTTAKNTAVIPATSGDYTNFAFTYQYYQLDENGNRISEKRDGVQGFYRIATGGAYSLGNQGYLPLETSQLSSETLNSSRGFELAFDDDDESGEITAIENIEANKSEVAAKAAVYYSLSGQQLSGKPAKGGIYICNGKKVIIK